MRSNKYFLTGGKPELEKEKLRSIIKQALVEDIGKGDITTNLTVPKEKKIKAKIEVKQDCLICGLGVAGEVFSLVDKGIKFKALVKEGQRVKHGKIIAELSGRARSILSAERVALNLLSMLSGIATRTREYVTRIDAYQVKITDTRKTIPGLRELEKYAVRIGGGYSHRMGLDEMILIKDNHIRAAEGLKALPRVPKGFKIEVEAENLDEFKHALRFKPDVIMLDNMRLKDLKRAVKIRNNTAFNTHHPRTKLEASGGINIKTVKKIAASGVDIISIGELTHTLQPVDMSLEVDA